MVARLPGGGGLDEVVEAVFSAINPRTRVAVIDHLTSESARLLPLAEIAERCHSANVPVLADGAHVPGMLPLDIESLGVDWYVGNLHKWAWAPRGTGLLGRGPTTSLACTRRLSRGGSEKGFTTEFDWTGTRDPSGWLTAPFAIDLMRGIGFDAIRTHNHRLAWTGSQILGDAWGTRPEAEEQWYGSMVTMPLPRSLGSTPEDATRLRDALLYEDRNRGPDTRAGGSSLGPDLSAGLHGPGGHRAARQRDRGPSRHPEGGVDPGLKTSPATAANGPV